MQNLSTHYQQLLGLPSPWKVDHVDLSIPDKQVTVKILYTGKSVQCLECGASFAIYDHAPEQKWRHLDTMQFETVLIARIPRCNCKQHGVKTAGVPWAEKHSRFTLMFEGFVVELLQHCSNTNAVSNMLGLSWHAVNQIMRRAVARGLKLRDMEAVENRTTEATEQLLGSLTDNQRSTVKAVALDMWHTFAKAVTNLVPGADIVHDRFHISKYLNNAVDTIRSQESRKLNESGDKTLNGSRYAWLRNPENMTDKQRASFDELMTCELKTGTAWSLKNIFRAFWRFTCPDSADYFFTYWCGVVDRSELKPLIAVKDMLVRHKNNLFNYCKHRISNAVSEGLNSKIQVIKASARGFHSFESCRNRILFYCAKLNMAIS